MIEPEPLGENAVDLIMIIQNVMNSKESSAIEKLSELMNIIYELKISFDEDDIELSSNDIDVIFALLIRSMSEIS